MDGNIIGPENLSLTDDANQASGHDDQESSVDDVAVSMAEKLTGPSRIDKSLIDFMTRPDAELGVKADSTPQSDVKTGPKSTP